MRDVEVVAFLLSHSIDLRHTTSTHAVSHSIPPIRGFWSLPPFPIQDTRSFVPSQPYQVRFFLRLTPIYEGSGFFH